MYEENGDDDFSLNASYCDIHGNHLNVLENDLGDRYISLSDLRKTGFRLFKKDKFNPTLVDQQQINKEFELYLLSMAKEYIIQNRTKVEEKDILQTIENCRQNILGNTRPHPSQLVPNRQVVKTSSNFQVSRTFNDPPATEENRGLPKPHSIRLSRSGGGEPDEDSGSTSIRQNQQRNNQTNQEGGHHVGKDLRDKRSSGNRDQGSKFNRNQGGNFNRNEGRNFNRDQGGKSNDEGHNRGRQSMNNQVRSLFEDGRKGRRSLDDQNNRPHGNGGPNRGNNFENRDNSCMMAAGGKFPVQRNDDNASMSDSGSTTRLNQGKREYVPSSSLNENETYKYDSSTYVADRIGPQDSRSRAANARNSDRFRAKLTDGGNCQNKVDSHDESAKGREDRSRSRSRNHDPKTDETDDSWDKPEASRSKAFVKVPVPLEELRDEDLVLLVGVDNNKFFVRTKECCTRFKALAEHIKSMDKSAGKSGFQSVRTDQLVLCSKDDYPTLCRANVCDIDGVIVRVRYVDFPGEDQVSIKSLRNVDEFLANEPKLVLETPVCEYLEKADADLYRFIEELVKAKSKATVVLTNGSFDLELKDGSLMSDEAKKLSAPEQDSNTEKNVENKEDGKKDKSLMDETEKDEDKNVESTNESEIDESSKTPHNHIVEEAPIFYEELETYVPEMGKNEYLVYSINSLDEIIAISQEQKSLEYFAEITPIEVTSTEPYIPEETECCLVRLEEAGAESWYRGTLVSIEDDDQYTVLCLDFGNEVTVKSKDLRKFPSIMKDTPILGITCSWIDVPHKKQVLEKLRELVKEGATVEIILEEYDTENRRYKVRMPDIRQQIVAAGLI